MYANVCIAGEKEKGDGGVERTEVCVCVGMSGFAYAGFRLFVG